MCHLMGLESYAKIKTQFGLEVANSGNSIMGIWQNSKLIVRTLADPSVGCSLHTEEIREMSQSDSRTCTLVTAAAQVGLPAENRICPEASAADPLGLTSKADQRTAMVSRWDTVPGRVLGQQGLVSEQLNSKSQIAQGNSEKFPLGMSITVRGGSADKIIKTKPRRIRISLMLTNI